MRVVAAHRCAEPCLGRSLQTIRAKLGVLTLGLVGEGVACRLNFEAFHSRIDFKCCVLAARPPESH